MGRGRPACVATTGKRAEQESRVEKPVTLPAVQRRGRWSFVFGLLLFWIGAAHAAGMPLNGAWQEVGPGDTPRSVMDAYRAVHLSRLDRKSVV